MRVMAASTSATLCGGFDLRDENEVGRLRNDLFEVGQSQRQLVDAHHALSGAEIHGAKSVANEQAGGIFLGMVDRILEVEDDRVGPVQSRVDEVLRLVAGKVEARAAETIFRRYGAGCEIGSGRAEFPSPSAARLTAASTRAAITNGSAPSSAMLTKACSTPSARSNVAHLLADIARRSTVPREIADRSRCRRWSALRW